MGVRVGERNEHGAVHDAVVVRRGSGDVRVGVRRIGEDIAVRLISPGGSRLHADVDEGSVGGVELSDPEGELVK